MEYPQSMEGEANVTEDEYKQIWLPVQYLDCVVL